MRTLNRSTGSALLVAASLAVLGCGGSDSDDPASAPQASVAPTVTAIPQTATATPGKGNKKHGKKHGKATPTPVETPTADPSRGVPQTTPTPGPDLPFAVTVSDDAVTPTLDSVPAGKPLKVTIKSQVDGVIGVKLLSNGVPVGIARIQPPEKEIFVLVRNLDPGKLVIRSHGHRANIDVTAGD